LTREFLLGGGVAGGAMRLTEELVLSRTRAPSLGEVKNLNLWGQSIADVTVLRRMPRVEVLSLSVNKIASLADFAGCSVLQELYLRKNEVPDLGELRHLQGLEQLKILWLCDNPCAAASDYRARVVLELPQLRKLDNQEITEEERQAAQRSDSPEVGAAGAVAARGTGDQLEGEAPQDSGGQEAEEGARGEVPASVPAPSVAPTSSPALTHPPERTARGSSLPASPPPTASGGNGENMRGGKLSSDSSPSANVLYAVIALLQDMDEDSLQIVKAEVDQRLAHG